MKRLQQYLQTCWWRFKNANSLQYISWSTIRRIGQSRILALTIIVPFLGSLLLFNQYVVDLLTISPNLVQRWFHIADANPSETAQRITFARLYYVYFGLSLLGMGSALFALFCPLDVKSYASPIEYIREEAPLLSPARIELMIPTIAYQFSHWLGDEPNTERGLLQRLGEPHDFISLFSMILSEAYRKLPHDDQGEIDPEGDLEQDHPYEDFRGRPDPPKIAYTIHSGARIQEGFVQSLFEILTGTFYRNDIMTLHYMSQDHSKPLVRLIVSGFYAAGFILLLIPTAITFLRLISYLLFSSQN